MVQLMLINWTTGIEWSGQRTYSSMVRRTSRFKVTRALDFFNRMSIGWAKQERFRGFCQRPNGISTEMMVNPWMKETVHRTSHFSFYIMNNIMVQGMLRSCCLF